MQQHMPKQLHLLILASVLGLTSGCMSTNVANSEQIELNAMEQASRANITTEDAIRQASADYEKAIASELQFFAPSHMESARDKLQSAVKLGKDTAKPEDKIAAISAAFAAKKLVVDAYKNKTTVESILSRVLEHRKVLAELNTDTIHPKLYRKATTKLESLIRDIEGGMLAEAKNDEASVLKYYAEVEIETLKTTYLNKAIQKLDEAKSNDADDIAEVTYEKAEQAVDYAGEFIEKNYRDREGVKRVSDIAYTEALHAYYVAEETAKIIQIDAEDAEQYILYVGGLLQRVNVEVGIKDLKAMAPREQARSLAEAVKISSMTYNTPVGRVVPSVSEPTASEQPSIYIVFDEEESEE
jgi:hypothetical protein